MMSVFFLSFFLKTHNGAVLEFTLDDVNRLNGRRSFFESVA